MLIYFNRFFKKIRANFDKDLSIILQRTLPKRFFTAFLTTGIKVVSPTKIISLMSFLLNFAS